jgi:hypothetical protein
MARHNGVPADLPRAVLVERIASNGLNLQSYSNHMATADLQKVAEVFGIDTSNPGRGGLSFAVWSFIQDYDKNLAREKFHRETGIPRLSGELLLTEVQKMARPCVHLTNNPGDGRFAGEWQGPGIVPVELADHEHWITLDCASLPEEFTSHPLTGAASVYVNRSEDVRGDCDDGGCVALDPSYVFDDKPRPSVRLGGRTLFPGEDCAEVRYARHGLSYPCVFEVICSPTKAIRDWLTQMGYGFAPGDYSSLPARELRDVYENVMAPLDPVLNDSSIAAVVGGWEVYCEYTYAASIGDDTQFVYTLWESEPWIQATICKKTGKFRVRQLIT